jgi:predicted alpha-1,6-mannanase (GH76 family)
MRLDHCLIPLRKLSCPFLILCVIGSLPARLPAQTSAAGSFAVSLKHAATGIKTLQRWYDTSSGLYRTTGWWNSANAITLLADYARLSHNRRFDAVFRKTFVAAQKTSRGFLNNYYDDEGWWALAWIDAYDLTGDPQYLAMARSIFADMAGGWDNTCGGGIWWSKDRKYKNAIANELFLSVAAHLAVRDDGHRQEYLDQANKEWAWFRQSGMVNAEHLINDGLGIRDGQSDAKTCINNGQTAWTYNQGVILGGLSELAKINPDPALLEAAKDIADAAIATMADKAGILHDTCEPNCGADGVQFKGIFARNLALLYRSSPQPAYKSFLENNAHAIWEHDRSRRFEFGVVWCGPFDGATAATQTSALDALLSAAFVEEPR